MNAGTRVFGQAALARGLVMALVAIVALVAETARAQPGPRGAPATPTLVVSVEFKGGTVADYVRALKDASKPSPVNVVLSEEAATDRLGPISLQQASLAAAMQAIPAASASGINMWQIIRLHDALPGEDAASDNEETAPVYQVYRAPGRKDTGPQRVVMEVFSLRRIVGHETDPAAAEARIAAVLTAAETALTMDQNATPPDMKLHKESGLLIVRGEQDDVMAVKDVIDRMSDDAGKLADEAAARESAVRQSEIHVQKAELNARTAESQLNLAKSKMGQVEQLVAQGATSATEALEMKAEVDRREASFKMALLEVQSAKEAAERARRGLSLGNLDRPRRSEVAGDDVQAVVRRLQDENAALRARLDEVTAQMQQLRAAMESGRANNPRGK